MRGRDESMPRTVAALPSSSATMARRLITGTSRFSITRTGCVTTMRAFSGTPRTRMASTTEVNSAAIVGKNRSATHSAMMAWRGRWTRWSAHASSPTRVVAIMFDANMPMQNTQRTTTRMTANEAAAELGASSDR